MYQKITKTLTYFYIVPLFAMIFFNTINSLLRTTYFDQYRDVEVAMYRWDSPVIVLFWIVIILGGIGFIHKKSTLSSLHLNRASLIFAGLFCLYFILLFRAEVTCDSSLISKLVIEFMHENYTAFSQGGYLYSYSFQIGFAALLELIYRLFGVENYITFQILNILSILIILHFLNKITKELFDEEAILKLESVLSFGMLPLFLFSTFVYGDIIGWSFGICAMYCIIRYLKMPSIKYIIITGLLFTFGTLIKSNINILVVAASIALFLYSIERKHYLSLLWIPILFLFSQIGVWGINYYYTLRAGLEEYPAGIPKIAWIAMSFQEADENGWACGWYNAYNWNVYVNNNYDRAKVTQDCLESLKESFYRFFHEQRYAINYFYKKFTSQWNAPTFQSMITNEWATRHVENLSSMAVFFIYGLGYRILYSLMNIFHFFIFLCSSCFFIKERKKWSLPKAYYLLNIFGGFLFHMLWEAQSRYILGYFVIMLPMAACGCYHLLNFIHQQISKRAMSPK